MKPKIRSVALSSFITVTALLSSHIAIADNSKNFVWTDGPTTRLEALALLETLNSELLSHDSATLTLDRWCEDHRLASPPARIIAEFVHGAEKPLSAEQRQILGVSPTEPIRYRQVRLSCGGHVLSEADNWYVPSRLTPEINHMLETSDIAFGRAAQSLKFRRHTLSAKLLWSPLPHNWEMAGTLTKPHDGVPLVVPHHVLQHVAVLTLPDGRPISQVVETYTEEVLDFPQPIAKP
ncbi:hypothetical protein [Hyphomicrobium sp. DY-1]|uniref:hypothetical protein n=1 Tax=Hyphomicrobium sp. DY-1 TaxID=3075650 RepID=UPI0039C41081